MAVTRGRVARWERQGGSGRALRRRWMTTLRFGSGELDSWGVDEEMLRV
jgi:hypothetical protein